jgi:crotonobetainyl-CoA:carnitine CoA-transferase CaiB-like acyl-CoA transferase
MQTTAHWLAILEPADVWCANVLTWPQLTAHEGFRALNMTQQVSRANGASLVTTRCPIRVDGNILTSPLGAPKVGEHNAEVRKEFLL